MLAALLAAGIPSWGRKVTLWDRALCSSPGWSGSRGAVIALHRKDGDARQPTLEGGWRAAGPGG